MRNSLLSFVTENLKAENFYLVNHSNQGKIQVLLQDLSKVDTLGLKELKSSYDYEGEL